MNGIYPDFFHVLEILGLNIAIFGKKLDHVLLAGVKDVLRAGTVQLRLYGNKVFGIRNIISRLEHRADEWLSGVVHLKCNLFIILIDYRDRELGSFASRNTLHKNFFLGGHGLLTRQDEDDRGLWRAKHPVCCFCAAMECSEMPSGDFFASDDFFPFFAIRQTS